MAKKKPSKGRARGYSRPAPSRGSGIPVLPVAVGGVLLAIGIVLFIMIATNYKSATPAGTAQSINGIDCNSNEQLQVHYHTHLDILRDGTPISIPAGIGIHTGDNCLYWIHVHNTDGIIHIEAPARASSRVFTLGDYFAIWKQPLDAKHVATFTLTNGQTVKAWVDGKPWTDDPKKIPLKSKEKVVIEITPPTVDPPPDYKWDDANYPA